MLNEELFLFKFLGFLVLTISGRAVWTLVIGGGQLNLAFKFVLILLKNFLEIASINERS